MNREQILEEIGDPAEIARDLEAFRKSTRYADEHWNECVEHYDVCLSFPLIIADAATPRALPSLLGRHILNRWHMAYRPTENQLTFEVVSADDVIDLAPYRAS